MKSFRQILGEVAQPKPDEERAFKDMHSYETMPHPVALDHQFTGAIGADDLPRQKAKRLADQEGDANYDTAYDDAMEYAGPSFDESVELDEAEDLQELSVGTLAKYVQKKVGKNARDSETLKAYYALSKTDAFKKLSKADKEPAMKLIKDQEAKVKKAEKGINLAKLKAKATADKLGVDIVFGKDGKHVSGSKMGFREQADQAIINKLSEGSAMAKSAALSKASATSKSGKSKVSLKKAPWDKNEEVELDEGFSPKQIEQLKKAYASMPDRVPMDMANKMSAVLKGRSKEELIAIARADIKWLSTTAATNLIMQGVKAKEING